MVGHPVEEVPVVGDDDQGAFEVEQVFFQDVEGQDVQVVGRFVEDQQVGLLDQDGEQVEPAAFAAGEAGDGVVPHIVGEEELFEQAGVADGLQHGLVFLELEAFLVIVADLERFAPFDPARGRFQCAGQQVDERTFADAVPSHDPDPVVALEFVAEIL